MATIDRWRPYGTAVERWEPFRGVNEIQGEMNRLLDSFFGRPATLVAGERMWAPLADMYETKDDLLVTFELPGVREKEVSVSITGDVLTVKGERRFERDVEDPSDFKRLENGEHGKGHRDRLGDDELGGGGRRGRQPDRDRESRGQSPHALGGRLHQGRRDSRRPGRQAPGHYEPGEHRVLDQAVHGPSPRRDL